MPCTAADAACTQPGSQLAAEQRLQQRGGCGQQRRETVRTLKVTSRAVQVVAVQALHEMPNMLHRGEAAGEHRFAQPATYSGVCRHSGGWTSVRRLFQAHPAWSGIQLAACSLQLRRATYPRQLSEHRPLASSERPYMHVRHLAFVASHCRRTHASGGCMSSEQRLVPRHTDAAVEPPMRPPRCTCIRCNVPRCTGVQHPPCQGRHFPALHWPRCVALAFLQYCM